MLSQEYCEIFKNTYFGEHLRTAASEAVMRVLIATLVCCEKTVNFDKIRIFDTETNIQFGF